MGCISSGGSAGGGAGGRAGDGGSAGGRIRVGPSYSGDIWTRHAMMQPRKAKKLRAHQATEQYTVTRSRKLASSYSGTNCPSSTNRQESSMHSPSSTIAEVKRASACGRHSL